MRRSVPCSARLHGRAGPDTVFFDGTCFLCNPADGWVCEDEGCVWKVEERVVPSAVVHADVSGVKAEADGSGGKVAAAAAPVSDGEAEGKGKGKVYLDEEGFQAPALNRAVSLGAREQKGEVVGGKQGQRKRHFNWHLPYGFL
ncbi:MAG: hypothetical protein LQ348_003952 [Seirophora lacunosa]|nr:MAG: hypothetical protein LQ348_003952 [Seirophora lacunosa]